MVSRRTFFKRAGALDALRAARPSADESRLMGQRMLAELRSVRQTGENIVLRELA